MLDKDKNIKQVSIYDFDGTLCFSPTPEIGKEIWKNKTGFEYPFKTEEEMETKPKFDGWWGRLESLDLDVFDIQLNPKVKNALLEDIVNDNVYTVLLTGRMKKRKTDFTEVIKTILNNHNIPELDDYLLNYGGNTLQFKLKEMDRLRKQFINLEKYIMWEDRMDHIPHFQKWGDENFGHNFNLNIIS